MKRVFFVISLLCCFTAAQAQIPETLTYQGVLTDASGKNLPDGQYNLTFTLYDAATAGNVLWTEAQTVEVRSGVFDAILGKQKALNVAFDKPYWLGLKVGTQPELAPRVQLTSSAYSLNARGVADNAVTANKIAAGQVVKSVNGLKDDVSLTAGNNVTIDKTGNTLKIVRGQHNSPTRGQDNSPTPCGRKRFKIGGFAPRRKDYVAGILPISFLRWESPLS